MTTTRPLLLMTIGKIAKTTKTEKLGKTGKPRKIGHETDPHAGVGLGDDFALAGGPLKEGEHGFVEENGHRPAVTDAERFQVQVAQGSQGCFFQTVAQGYRIKVRIDFPQFAEGKNATMALRDLSEEILKRLFQGVHPGTNRVFVGKESVHLASFLRVAFAGKMMFQPAPQAEDFREIHALLG